MAKKELEIKGFLLYLQNKYELKDMAEDYQTYLTILSRQTERNASIYPPVEVAHLAFEDIVQTVSLATGVQVSQMLSKSRKREKTIARHFVCYYACYKNLGSLAWIGKRLGGRDHSTVIHGRDNIVDLLEIKDKNIVAIYEATKHLLN